MTLESEQREVGSLGALPATIAVVVLLGTHIALRRDFEPGHAMRMAVTSLLIIAFGWVVLSSVRLVRSLDELQRKIQLEAVAIGYTLAIGLVFAVGFLRGEGLLLGADPRDLAMLLIVPYVLGLVIARRRYR